MSQSRTTITIAAALLVMLFAGSVFSLRKIDAARGKEASLEEILYLPSGKAVKRLSLGYSSLLADIYWTRAVQYFGSKHLAHSQRYDLLDPLLNITTDLDPNLVVAYQTGSIFLCQQPPDGAGEPDKAVALLEKGIAANPTYWRMYFSLGFVHYLERHDYKAAQQAFQKGSEIPGALPWMKVMAAKMAEHAEEIDTAILLWKGVYETSKDKTIRETALKHLASLQAEMDMQELRHRVHAYREKTGAWPATWVDLVRAGLLAGVPTDPAGKIYKLLPEGGVWVEDPTQFPYFNEAATAH
jgi:tetratricopeptide (TPR) repeat protein